MPPLLKVLNYDTSANFISAEDASRFGSSPYGHLCRKAANRGLGFQGIYTLKQRSAEAPTPVVALFKVADESQAKEVHRLLWNQDFIPFILVESPSSIRLYSGFSYQKTSNGESDLIAPLRDFNRIQEHLEGFRAEDIDNGTLWSKWGQHVDPTQRVDWHLLENLAKLGQKLRDEGLNKDISHAFIGRYVYLRYLKDRGFLSERKLAKWGLKEAEVFSRNATLKAFKILNEKLDGETDGLNGSVFPFAISSISKQHLLTVASAFAGDDPSTGQTVLDFAVYDFSYIPIETLSIIYEQFLHEPATNGGVSRARQQGAYYTPITLVNYMLSEMDSRHPLKPEMKVLDPSCGSGAFLVQTYRMLIERAIKQSGGHSLNPSKLREILQTQIFGVDRDQDACRIAEMSLLVTLLDYVNPPDLEGKFKGFLLPTLANSNIFEADFFDDSSTWQEELTKRSSPAPFDWIVGNPPWKEIKNPPKDPLDQKALTWMLKGDSPPTGGNQLAEAFIWKSQPLMKAGAIAGVVLPAMTLFKSESTPFRKALFTRTQVQGIINFSNLCYVLFSGRTAVPAMSLFFKNPTEGIASNTPIQVYSPFVIDQEANRPKRAGKQLDTWTLTVDGDDVREIPSQQATQGDALTWKLAMWGSERDRKLLDRISRKFVSLQEFSEEQCLVVSQGIELRGEDAPNESVEHHPELEGMALN